MSLLPNNIHPPEFLISDEEAKQKANMQHWLN
jgi:hypothetical protein